MTKLLARTVGVHIAKPRRIRRMFAPDADLRTIKKYVPVVNPTGMTRRSKNVKKLTLLNRTIKGVSGTFGVLKYQTRTWFTCERPWLDNQNNVSCIPAGSYLCRWTLSPRLKRETYEVLNVPRRSGIRIHSANFPDQILGCVALGEKFGTMEGKAGVFMSVSAIRNFNSLLNKEDFTLEVKQ